MNKFKYIVSGIWFITLASARRVWYNTAYDDTWDYTELNREGPACYFYTGKRD